jgi:hypothetical protein
MIQLHPDYLIIQTSQGENIPCSGETVTIELMGEAASSLDPEVVREAAAAVVHYFKEELKQEHVSVAEFSTALERVLNGFGYDVSSSPSDAPATEQNVAVGHLDELASQSDFELIFFRNLRDEFHTLIEKSPDTVRFQGLRNCAKRLAGAKHWCRRCELLSDQIVTFLRECLAVEAGAAGKGLVIM